MKLAPDNIPQHIVDKMTSEERKSRGLFSSAERLALSRKSSHQADTRAERELQQDIAQYLRLRGIPFINPPMHKRSMLPDGWPDFTLAYRSVPIVIEVKNEAGVVSDEQSRMMDLLKAGGWVVRVVRSLPEVKELMDGLEDRRVV